MKQYCYKTNDFFGDLSQGEGIVDIWSTDDPSLPGFSMADDDNIQIPEGDNFAFEKVVDDWYDICVRKMDERVAKIAVAAVLSHHFGYEVKPEQIVFHVATENLRA